MNRNFTDTFPNIVISDSFRDASLGLIYYTPTGKLIHANQAVKNILGFSDEQIATLQLSEITHPEDSYKFENLSTIIQDDPYKSHTIEFRCFDANGGLLYLRMLFCTIMSDDGKPKYILSILENLTEQLSVLEEKRLNRKLFEVIAEHTPSTVWLATADLETVLFVNDYFCEVIGLDKEDVIGSSGWRIMNLVHPDDVERVKSLISSFPNENDQWRLDYRIMRPDNKILHIEDRGRVVRDEDGNAIYLLGSHHDVTEKVLYMQKLESLNSELQKAYDKVKRLSEYDSLTNSLNRAAMTNRLSDALYQFNRYEIPSTLIYIDLDNFKKINDKYGHYAGDQILIAFTEKIQAAIRQTDVLGRMGGDEFLLLFPGANQISAEQFLLKHEKQFETIIDLPNNTPTKISLKYSTGIAEIDFAINNIDEWIDIADRAMYVDKISSQ